MGTAVLGKQGRNVPSKLFSDWLELVSSTATGSAAQSLFGHERAFTRLEKHVRNDWFLNVQQTSLNVAHARAKSQSGHSKLRDAGWRKRLRERQLIERSKYSYRPIGDVGAFLVDWPVYFCQRPFVGTVAEIRIQRS